MGFEIENGILRKYTEEDGVTDVVIPDGVTVINGYAFKDCKSITSVTIPDSVIYIGIWAFAACKNLKSIIIPDNVTSIGMCAFTQCESLISIIIPDGVTSIDGAFWGCKSLKSINIPYSVTYIGNGTFCRCSSLTSINIPDSVTSIGYRAFFDCSNLTSISIPDSVTSIGNEAFYQCSNLKSITLKSKDSSITINDNLIEYNGSLNKDVEKILNFMRNEKEEKDKILRELYSIHAKITVAIYLIKKYNHKSASTMIKDSVAQIVPYLIDEDDVEKIVDILTFGFVTKENIDDMIKYSIDHKKPEIQIILSNYKNDNFGFNDNFDKFML